MPEPRPQASEERKAELRAARARRLLIRQQAFDLRLGGASYHQIGSALKISRQAAWQMVRSVLDEQAAKLSETAERARAMDLARLDGLVMTHWPQRSDPRRSEVILRALDRRAHLLGLDAPVKIEGAVEVKHTYDFSGFSDEELSGLRDTLLRARAATATVLAETVEATPLLPASTSTKVNGANGHGGNGTP